MQQHPSSEFKALFRIFIETQTKNRGLGRSFVFFAQPKTEKSQGRIAATQAF